MKNKKNISSVAKSWSPVASKAKKQVAVKEGRFTAMCDWLGTRDLSHQNHIRSGNLMESFMNDIVRDSGVAELIEDVTVKTHVADLLFKLFVEPNSPDYKIVYREMKGNVNLDSEKWKANANKIVDVDAGLRARYPNREIDSGFLCPSWMYGQDTVEGFNDFITMLGYEELTYDEFVALGLELGSKVRAALAI